MLMLPEILLADYQYDLPDERIAHYPVEPRDTSQLLVSQNGHIVHQHFYQLPELLPSDSFLLFNDTKVIPARLFFQKSTGSVIEIFLLHPEIPTRVINDAMQQTEHCVWSCMIGNKKRWKLGEVLSLQFAVHSPQFTVHSPQSSVHSSQSTVPTVDSLLCTLEVSWAGYEKNWVKFTWSYSNEAQYRPLTFVEVVKALGELPLPPYLNRKADQQDHVSYQTVYSHTEGAVAAPTAGLHFTENIFTALTNKGIKHDFVTLHVGAGTFQPVKVANAVEHTMHSEQVVFKKSLIDNLIKNIEHIIVVGTTSMRSLESLFWFGVKLVNLTLPVPFLIEKLAPYQKYNHLPTPKEALQAVIAYMEAKDLDELVGETEVLIFPGYEFKLCKGLITNFHQPGSTLMLLVAAFVGPHWRKIYEDALTNHYRFLSYGDSSLLLP